MSTSPADPETRPETAPPAERAIWEALRTVEDPELPVSVVDLGLVYRVSVEGGRAEIDVTLTYSGCPARDLILSDVEAAAAKVEAVDDVDVRVVYSPAWSHDRITTRGRRALNDFGLAVPGDDDSPDPDCY